MERYVDPNSGAAPQPGGYAGPQGAEKGFAMSSDEPLENEQEPSRYEAPGVDGGGHKSVDEIAKLAEERKPESEDEKSEADKLRIEAVSNPKKVLADLDEGDSASSQESEPGQEAEANDDQSLEHQALDPRNPEVEAGSYDPSQYSVEEVKQYLADNPDQADAVKAAERQGKNRKGVTGDE